MSARTPHQWKQSNVEAHFNDSRRCRLTMLSIVKMSCVFSFPKEWTPSDTCIGSLKCASRCAINWSLLLLPSSPVRTQRYHMQELRFHFPSRAAHLKSYRERFGEATEEHLGIYVAYVHWRCLPLSLSWRCLPLNLSWRSTRERRQRL